MTQKTSLFVGIFVVDLWCFRIPCRTITLPNKAFMRIKELHLTNIGPFNDAHLEFAADDAPRVTIITGENGTGKTIVLDAIRELFGGGYAVMERSIFRNKRHFEIKMRLEVDSQSETIVANKLEGVNQIDKNFRAEKVFRLMRNNSISTLPYSLTTEDVICPNWIVDYWKPNLFAESAASDESSLIDSSDYILPDPKYYLVKSLQGIHTNQGTSRYIYFFENLSNSRDPKEKQIGEVIYPILEKIVKVSLLEGGKLKFVRRSELMPIIEQNGMEVPLSNLSSGNLYMIQRLVSLLGKMYAVHILRQTPPETLCETPGLLLIDEAENHLHPKWQKRFIPTILEIFPNLQIIATTHSPFIVSSVKGAKVYVCKPHTDHCTIEDETDYYVNKPVDEVLASPVFDTSPFSKDISTLLQERKKAISEGNKEERERIEARLQEENPEYFAYFDIDKRMEALMQGVEQ